MRGSEYLIGEDVERSGRGLFKGNIPEFACIFLRITIKI